LTFKDGEKRFLRNLHATNTLHAPPALFLLFEELPLPTDVTAIALGEDVLTASRNRFTSDDLAADGRLEGDFV